ncbi:MAG: Guanylate kinase [Candidatus Moranbacteria bacterium GW2011_GWE1_49_15]|nr:MAG: Guanylate kinase [Candidatus Moranbacteria bacterium GW2011_GWE1_49_15]
MKNVFIISGPSGAGEDSIIEGLRSHFPIERVVTTTTREMRPGESQGNPYYFISKQDFENGISQGKFVEYARQYNGNLYGVTKEEIERVEKSGKVGAWKIEYKGVMTAQKLFPGIISIFITVPSLDILEKRIKRRDGVSDEYIRERMEYTKEWLKYAHIYDYEIINHEGKLDRAIQETADIINKHKNA